MEPYKQRKLVKESYEKIAALYSDDRSISPTASLFVEFVSRLLQGAHVLDAGCGSGVLVSKALVEAGFKVTGADFTMSMLTLARRVVPQVEHVQSDLTCIAFRGRVFDGIVSAYTVIHIPRVQQRSVFKQFFSILRPGGLMLVSFGSGAWEGVEDDWYGEPMSWSHYAPEESRDIIESTGFRIILDRFDEFRSDHGTERPYWVLARKP